jgi:hypothetical protein
VQFDKEDQKGKTMKFTSIKDAIEYLDIGALRDKIQVGGGIAARVYGSGEIAQNADELIRFVDTYELKRELEAQFAEGDGVVDFTPAPGEEPLIEGDYFAQVDVVQRLYASWQARKALRNNVIEMKPLSR